MTLHQPTIKTPQKRSPDPHDATLPPVQDSRQAITALQKINRELTNEVTRLGLRNNPETRAVIDEIRYRCTTKNWQNTPAELQKLLQEGEAIRKTISLCKTIDNEIVNHMAINKLWGENGHALNRILAWRKNPAQDLRSETISSLAEDITRLSRIAKASELIKKEAELGHISMALNNPTLDLTTKGKLASLYRQADTGHWKDITDSKQAVNLLRNTQAIAGQLAALTPSPPSTDSTTPSSGAQYSAPLGSRTAPTQMPRPVGLSAQKLTRLPPFSQAFKNFSPYLSAVDQASINHNIPPALILGIINAESSFDIKALSNKNARGPMQLLDGTAAENDVTNLNDPAQNINGGTMYIAKLLNRYNGNLEQALAAYNAGPGKVPKRGPIPSYTKNYVQKVIRSTEQWEQRLIQANQT